MNFFSPKKIPAFDVIILSAFIVIVTYPIFMFQGSINLFELGLYLPAIDGILQGSVPYRDFFYLRGPVDLYLPALGMRIFGEHLSVLMVYFYLGTVFTLLVYLMVARRILSNRLMLWLFVLVFVARTFPRVVFTYWGGLRFAWGILAVLALFMFLEKQKYRWLILAGALAAMGLLTSLDVGLSALAALSTVLIFALLDKDLKTAVQNLAYCILGLLLVAVPFAVYLISQGALGAFFESQIIVATQMQTVFNSQDQDFAFKHLTPIGLYIFIIAWLFLRRKESDLRWKKVAVLFMYGLALYVLSFRNIQAAQFEMALQPEKILLFFLLAEIGQFLWDKYQSRRIIFYLFAFGVIGSSLGYSLQRYDHRFPAFQVMAGKKVERLQGRMVLLPALQGLFLPEAQAQEFEAVNAFVQGHVREGQKVIFYDELGIYHALVGRPFVDRFPTVIFTWLDEKWHKRYVKALSDEPPEYIFVARDNPAWFEGIYFQHSPNREKFDEFYRFLDSHYRKAEALVGLDVYQNKDGL